MADNKLNLDVVIKAKLDAFQKDFYPDANVDSTLFERFVNYHMLQKFWKKNLLNQDSMVDKISIGGGNDLGIDGIIILFNHYPVTTLDDVDSFIDECISRGQYVDLEFVFIQTKCQSEFDSGDYLKFTNGVLSFLSDDNIQQPVNDRIQEYIKIKNALLNHTPQPLPYVELPTVRTYYVFEGKNNGYTQVADYNRQFMNNRNIVNKFTVNDEQLCLVDASGLRCVCNENDNEYRGFLQVTNFQQMNVSNKPEITGNLGVGFVSGETLYKFCSTNDGELRESLFADNVRGYLGDTTINTDIEATIKNKPEEFRILNNGITIVCDSFQQIGDRVDVNNPQIVNGCQTSTTIYKAGRQNASLCDVSVLVRIIATRDQQFIADIVRGTNKQNIVYDEAFEGIKAYHKELEEFFPCMDNMKRVPLFYERRTKQYNDSHIPKEQIFTLKNLVQGDIAIFRDSPYKAHKHESVLLREFKDVIFQKEIPRERYYAVAILEYYFNEYFKKHSDDKKIYKTYQFHLMWITKMLIDSRKGPYQNSKGYLHLINRFENDADKLIAQTISVFQNCIDTWQHDGHSKDGIKDNNNFTNHTREYIKNVQKGKNNELLTPKYDEKGKVGIVRQDRYGNYYAFVESSHGTRFLHELQNPQVAIAGLYGKQIGYSIKPAEEGQYPYAVNAVVIDG